MDRRHPHTYVHELVLTGRLIAQIQPGGPGNTYTWGVQLAGGSRYASDMVSGLWQLETP